MTFNPKDSLTTLLAFLVVTLRMVSHSHYLMIALRFPMAHKDRLSFVHSSDRKISDGQMFGVHLLPVWAYTLAAYIPENEFTVTLVDDRIKGVGSAEEAEIFVYSAINQDVRALLENRAILVKKFPRSLHIVGGPICWSFKQAGILEKLFAFDHVFVGDGERLFPEFLKKWRQHAQQERVLETTERFPLEESRPMHRELLKSTMHSYYGAVVEVSRGCPFLCEFCDIRVLPDNNRSHTRSPAQIVEEVDFFARHGVAQIILACDNFIGNSKWAEALCDTLIAWRASSGFSPSFYTWASIDLARHPTLITKLKAAGIDTLFIGVESFFRNSLLETSKVQNTSIDLVDEIRKIQSHGLIVVAGLIFGFDTDPQDVVDITLDGIHRSGLISGDPSLLTALPGTPLYMRMQLSKRLRKGKVGLGGMKYQTNIRYLKPKEMIVDDFTRFVKIFNSGDFQFARLSSFYDCLESVPAGSAGFGSLSSLARVIFLRPKAAALMAKRFFLLLASTKRIRFIAKAFFLTHRLSKLKGSHWYYFKFWLFNWSNSVLKYSRISAKDFDIDTVGEDFTLNDLVPMGYEKSYFEPIPHHKIAMQRKITADSLRRLVK